MARHTWVDHAKSLGMILVVYGHAARGVHAAGLPLNGPWYDGVDNVLYGFHMPLFFFLSGLFFQRSLDGGGTWRTIENRARTILYPYVIWSLAQGLVEVALSRYTNSGAHMSDLASFPWHPRAQFWFLYVMFGYCVVGAVLFARRTSLRLTGAVVVALLMYVHGFGDDPSGLARQFDTNAIYFVVGVAIGDADRAARVFRNAWVFAACALVFMLCELWLNEWTTLTYRDQGTAGLVIGFSGIGLTCGVAMRTSLARVPILAAIGVYSMAIYVLHILVIAGIRISLVKWLGVKDIYFILIVATTLGVLIPLGVARRLEKLQIGFVFSLPKTPFVRRRSS